MKNNLFILIITALLAGTLSLNAQNGPAAIRGTLIIASNQASGIDPALSRYEAQLRRLNFSAFKAIGGGAAKFSPGGDASINLGGGFTVQVRTAPGADNRGPVEVRWIENKRTLIHTSGPLPLVLGGPRHPNGNLILILDAP
jgi:hypothetical protein